MYRDVKTIKQRCNAAVFLDSTIHYADFIIANSRYLSKFETDFFSI